MELNGEDDGGTQLGQSLIPQKAGLSQRHPPILAKLLHRQKSKQRRH